MMWPAPGISQPRAGAIIDIMLAGCAGSAVGFVFTVVEFAIR
jgi:hypothetical protein